MSNLKEPLKTSRILIEILLGIITGVLLWIIIITSLKISKPTIVLIFNFILISVSVIGAIKLTKKDYKILASILLIFLIPAILLLLLFGACTGMGGLQ